MAMPLHTSFRFDTDAFPERARFDSWREMMAATHDVSLPSGQAPPFRAEMVLSHLDHLLLSHGTFSAQVFTRGAGNIRRDQLDHYGLFVQGAGRRVVQYGPDDAECVLRPSDVLVIDLAQTTRAVTTEGASGTLYLPREIVDEVVPGFAALHGSVLRDAAARLLAHHLFTLGRLLPELSPGTVARVSGATREMALACLIEHAGTARDSHAPAEGALRRTIERHIDARLGEPDLSPATICQQFGISRTTLYRLFDVHGGVAGFIKQRRLLRIRTVILAGADPRPLAEIAQDYGFRTGAHFSREYARAFGHPPRDARVRRDEPAMPRPEAQVGIDRLFHSLQP